jgi:hypothetical protein
MGLANFWVLEIKQWARIVALSLRTSGLAGKANMEHD